MWELSYSTGREGGRTRLFTAWQFYDIGSYSILRVQRGSCQWNSRWREVK